MYRLKLNYHGFVPVRPSLRKKERGYASSWIDAIDAAIASFEEVHDDKLNPDLVEWAHDAGSSMMTEAYPVGMPLFPEEAVHVFHLEFKEETEDVRR